MLSLPPGIAVNVILPRTATKDASRLVLARALRGFADGFVSVYLAAYLQLIGFSAFQIGAVVTATLVGSACLTLAVGLSAHRLTARNVLFGATMLMAATGAGFAFFDTFWALLIVGFLGTLNPSAGDVSVFLPTEQSVLAGEVAAADRTSLFAYYSLAGTLCAAFGALLSGLPESIAGSFSLPVARAFRAGFAIYGIFAVLIVLLYRQLHRGQTSAPNVLGNAPLRHSRRIVLQLTALFALDSFGGGFAVDSLLALWLFLRFDMSLQTAAAVFFGTRALAALSQLASPYLAARFGMIETMVFTHIPASLFLITAAFMPTAPLAVTFLLLRMAFSSMDIPARQSYVMAVVPPEERAAAASMTNVPRSLTSAISPLLAGALLQVTTFGWPLILGGTCKITYDLLLLKKFRRVRPPA